MGPKDRQLTAWLQKQWPSIEAQQKYKSRNDLKERLIRLHDQNFKPSETSVEIIRHFVNKKFKDSRSQKQSIPNSHIPKDNTKKDQKKQTLDEQKKLTTKTHQKATSQKQLQKEGHSLERNTSQTTHSARPDIPPKFNELQPAASDSSTSDLPPSASSVAVSRKVNEFIQFYEEQRASNIEDRSSRYFDYQELEEALISEAVALDQTKRTQQKLPNTDLIHSSTYNSQKEYWSLLGRFTYNPIFPDEKEQREKAYVDTNVPCSVFICGLQGSGKSHTVTCLLENYLLNDWTGHSARVKCSAMVFYHNFETSGSGVRPCEVAFMGCSDPELLGQPVVERIVVFAAPSNLIRLREIYSKLPNVTVKPLKFKHTQLSAEKMLCLMSVEESSHRPLYIGTVTRILRELATQEGGLFSYTKFKKRLKEEELLGSQAVPLEQRLSLLEEFIDMEGPGADLALEKGTLAVIDLSCPFVERSLACALFKISMNIYLESDKSPGKVLVFDEAHQYLKDDSTSRVLTDSVLSAIRLQRHHGVRVLISTQEPSTAPQIIDLSTAVFIHRFTSPAWLNMLSKHIIVETDDHQKSNVFKAIQNLATGEALVFCPSACLQKVKEEQNNAQFMSVQVRRKMTWDAGKSIYCSTGQN